MVAPSAARSGGGPPEPGARVTVVKLRPDGSEAARYEGEVLPGPTGWVVVRATWGHGRIVVDDLVFEPGDTLVEYFSLDRPLNAFAVHDLAGALRGWYCNVTYPTVAADGEVVWHDLYVDVLVYPDGRVAVLDEDELEAAGVRERDPDLFALIERGKAMLLRLARDGAYPFSERAHQLAG